MIRATLCMIASLVALGEAPGMDCPFPKSKPPESRPSGCEVGAELPSFFVREINGNQPNLAVCLVCKNGDRPIVLVLVRKSDKQVERLLPTPAAPASKSDESPAKRDGEKAESTKP